MQWLAITNHWSAYVPAIMDRWPEADEDDLLALDGTPEELTGYLVKRTGRAYQAIVDEVEEWREGATPADVRMDESEDMRNIAASERYLPEGEDPSDDDAAYGDEETPDQPLGRTG